MWLLLAFTSALLLGLYDVAKKQALRDNAVLPVLLLNTLFSSLLFLPTILSTAAVLGAASGLYDKFITRRLDPVFVQSWYTFYQFWMMSAAVLLIWWPRRRRTTPFHWSWAIPFISLFLSAADLCYLYALSDSEAMISVVSMIRRGSVVVSFGFGALLFRERNLRAKAIDLALILVGMVFLWIGSR